MAYYVGFPAGAVSGSAADELRLRFEQRRRRGVCGRPASDDVRAEAAPPPRAARAGERPAGVSESDRHQHRDRHRPRGRVPRARHRIGGNVPGAGMVLASGLFDEVKIESLMREHGATGRDIQGQAAHRGGAERRTAGTGRERRARGRAHASTSRARARVPEAGARGGGQRQSDPAAVDLEHGGENVTDNDEVMNLIRSIDSGNAWAVGRFDAIQSAAKLPPVLSQLPAITWFSVTGQINDTISGTVRAETRDEESAKNLRDVVNGLPGARQAAGGIEAGVPGAGSVAPARRHRKNGGAVVCRARRRLRPHRERRQSGAQDESRHTEYFGSRVFALHSTRDRPRCR